MKSSIPAQPHHHPHSTPGQRIVANCACAFLASVWTLLPYSASAANRTAADALDRYQEYALDRDALRLEIERKDPSSTIYRLQRAALRQRAALAYSQSFYSGRGALARNAKRALGFFFVLAVWLSLLEQDRSLTRLVSEFFSNVSQFLSL